jgi:hypothetical protein
MDIPDDTVILSQTRGPVGPAPSSIPTLTHDRT